MSFSPSRSKTILNWIKKNSYLVDDYEVEDDNWGGSEFGPYSHWVYLTPGYICEEVHHIHEYSISDFVEQVKLIEKCDCDECKELIAEQHKELLPLIEKA